MLYSIITVKNVNYKLRLSAKSAVELEKRLGCNPLTVFMEVSKGAIPKLSDVLVMFHQSLLDFQKGLTLEDAYEIYEDYCEEGKSMYDLITVIMKVFQESGLLPKDEVVEKNA